MGCWFSNHQITSRSVKIVLLEKFEQQLLPIMIRIITFSYVNVIKLLKKKLLMAYFLKPILINKYKLRKLQYIFRALSPLSLVFEPAHNDLRSSTVA